MEPDKVIALGGNPNVGKSTVFNALTGLKQHTGNWSGKTVTNATGYCTYKKTRYILVDLPGCYSLLSHSGEEETARDFICSGAADAVVIVCDATCLERNLILVLQTLAITSKVVVCVNLIDEAKKKRIHIDLHTLSEKLGVPVIGTAARNGKGLDTLMDTVAQITQTPLSSALPVKLQYPDDIQHTLSIPEPDTLAAQSMITNHSTNTPFRDDIITSIVKKAEEIYKSAITCENQSYKTHDSAIDHILTGKWTAFPIMFLTLMGIFWLTIIGANYPSQLISSFLFRIEQPLFTLFNWLHAPVFLSEMLILGAYRVLAWVVSVMLPPMAIFFPLFTLLEDVGFLPRIAFNLDRCFKTCCACGKQALTMCMGFGCNAAGIVGCRIIDSPRERLIAIITNNFVPCNGRFPTLIAMISMFFISPVMGKAASIASALLLTAVIVLGIFMTFLTSWLLSKTLLKGVPSSFTLELPPYRKPQIGKVIVRSIFDRTLFVLGRAVCVAIPAGLILWLMANIFIGDKTLLLHCSAFLDPFARYLGMDGVILIAFILGFPANEIVIPIIIMAYMANGTLAELENFSALKQLLLENGWTWITAVSVMLFSLMHWPCSTTCLTIKKETQSLKWTLVSILIPTVIGIIVCSLFTFTARLIVSLT